MKRFVALHPPERLPFRVSMNSTSLPASWAHPLPGDTAVRPHVPLLRGLEWHLQRRCSMTPSQLALSFGVVLLASAVIALGFWWAGAPIVSAFAGLEVLLVAGGFAWHALHAADGERVCLHGPALMVDVRRGLRAQRVVMDTQWLRVLPSPDGGIELIEGRRAMRIGALVDEATSRRVQKELSQALAATRRTGPESE